MNVILCTKSCAFVFLAAVEIMKHRQFFCVMKIESLANKLSTDVICQGTQRWGAGSPMGVG